MDKDKITQALWSVANSALEINGNGSPFQDRHNSLRHTIEWWSDWLSKETASVPVTVVKSIRDVLVNENKPIQDRVDFVVPALNHFIEG